MKNTWSVFIIAKWDEAHSKIKYTEREDNFFVYFFVYFYMYIVCKYFLCENPK